MNFLVVSDTHGDYRALKAALEACSDFDSLIFLGDGEREFERLSSERPDLAAVYVRGNCDYGDYPTSHVVQAGRSRIFCTHGHRFGVKSDANLLALTAAENGCDIALFGHTHIPFNETVCGVRVVNPGSLGEPRGGRRPSYAFVQIDENGAVTINIREIGK